MAVYSIEARGVTKRFGAVPACDEIDLKTQAGEIHALLGENGAGKTTLMRILSGFIKPDEGTILLNGAPVQFDSPRDAIRLGIGMVHQRYRLIEKFTVTDNLLLGSSFAGARSDFARHLENLGKHFGIEVNPEVYVWQLSDGERQRVEILRVLQRGADVLILDEPTGVLSPQECVQLFIALKKMTAEGKTIILISHKMEEVLQWCDSITVLRKGKTVASRETSGVTASELAELTVGSKVNLASALRNRSGPSDVVLKLQNVSAAGVQLMSSLRGISLELRGREILGVAGLSGNGQTELAEVCVGLRKLTHGKITIQNKDITGLSVSQVVSAGVRFIPEDRVGTAVCPNMGTNENLVLRDLMSGRFSRWGVLNKSKINKWAQDKIDAFNIRLPDMFGPIRRLSGGNMQKVVVARELGKPLKVLIAAQPIRGLDVAATDSVHRMIMEARQSGTAVLLISEDLDELTKLSDRLIVMHRGEITAELPRNPSREKIGLAMAGVRVEDATNPAR
jgi:general nucleoside transport system ATP-binding protein